MKQFLTYVRIAKRNKGLLYYYECNGYVYSPCRDLFGVPVINFRVKDKNGKEIYGKEMKKKDFEEIKQLKTRKNESSRI